MLFALLIAASAPAGRLPSSILIQGVQVIDARGSQGTHDVLIVGARIAALDPTRAPANAQTIDGRGRTLLPGLIDSHTHISFTAGRAWLDQGGAGERQALALRSYLAWGVTTIVDPGIQPETVRRVAMIAGHQPAPDLRVVGPLLGPSGGYPGVIFPEFTGVGSPEEITTALDTFKGLDTHGVKITMEDGPLQSVWPLHTEQMRQALVAETDARGLHRYIHAMDPEMTRLALELDPWAGAFAFGGHSLIR